jgi:hypothetical protein
VVVTPNAKSKGNRKKDKAAGAASAEGVSKLGTINLLTQDELVQGCRIAHEIDNQIDAKLGERWPEFAESRRLMNLDALVGPPSVGTSGGTPDALIAAAEANIASKVAAEEMVVLHLRHIEDAVERGMRPGTVRSCLSLRARKLLRSSEWKTIESASKRPTLEAEIKPAVLGESKDPRWRRRSSRRCWARSRRSSRCTRALSSS